MFAILDVLFWQGGGLHINVYTGRVINVETATLTNCNVYQNTAYQVSGRRILEPEHPNAPWRLTDCVPVLPLCAPLPSGVGRR